jgi:hypothetical protein
MPHISKTDLACCKRQNPQFFQFIRKEDEIALQHKDIARPQDDVPQTLSEPLAAPTDCEEIDSEVLVQRHALCGLSDQDGGGADYSFNSTDFRAMRQSW